MIHPDEALLLLYAYGEVVDTSTRELEEHLACCPECHARFGAIERGRALADLALIRHPSGRRRILPVTALALAVAATLAGIVLVRGRETEPPRVVTANPNHRPAVAGYVTGGPDLMAVDSILSRLEREVSDAKR